MSFRLPFRRNKTEAPVKMGLRSEPEYMSAEAKQQIRDKMSQDMASAREKRGNTAKD